MTEQTYEKAEGVTPTPAVPEQAPPTGARQDPNPGSRADLVAALLDHLGRLGIATGQPARSALVAGLRITCSGGGLTQKIALTADPVRPGRYQWVWLWADGLRGEGPITPERMCAGEEIETATSAVARVLGVRHVAM
jgi:hypothetical protein